MVDPKRKVVKVRFMDQAKRMAVGERFQVYRSQDGVLALIGRLRVTESYNGLAHVSPEGVSISQLTEGVVLMAP